ncbi:hypothetical protein DMA11_09810 [Marinilabiliaceae bacterium JC017]|nr:hypothetical protein DMA11_09810 [Marinilabiliaceae bacterium JC017]
MIELIKNRRSCRKFTQSPVSTESIEQLKIASLLAPTSKNNRPWEFAFITDKEILNKLSQSKPHGALFLKDAALGIVILADPEKSDVWIEDTAIAASYIQLTAEALKLGSCWIQIRNRSHSETLSASEYIKKIIGAPSTLKVACIIAIGHKEKERRPYNSNDLLTDKIISNHY